MIAKHISDAVKFDELRDSVCAPILPLRELIGVSRACGLRHDVDLDTSRALTLARIEYALGVRSTYFFLHSADYFDASSFGDICKEISGYGHEIGLHNDALVDSYKTRIPVEDILSQALSRLRGFGVEVVGTSAHGCSETYSKGLYNYGVWSEFDPNKNEGAPSTLQYPLDKFGLKYEAYFTNYSFYLTDSGSHWSGIQIKGKKPYERELYTNTCYAGRTILSEFNSADKCILQILTHPTYWQM